jgi:CHAD domain-containing protein
MPAPPPLAAPFAAALRAPAAVVAGLDAKRPVPFTAGQVHQLRVAARRLRAGLRLFAEAGEPRWRRGLHEALRGLLEALGPARDADVWLDRLADRRAVGLPAAHPDWPMILAAERRRTAAAHATAADYLAGRRGSALRRRVAALAKGRTRPGRLPAEAWRRLRRLLRSLRRRRDPVGDRRPAEVHAFRRRCRRARYWAEYLATTGGAEAARLVRDLTNLTDALGEARDAELAVRRLARRQAWWTAHVRRRFGRQAKAGKREFRRRWRRFRTRWDESSIRRLRD